MKNGFSFLELFIVIIIIGLLSAIAVPAFFHAKNQAIANKKLELSIYNEVVNMAKDKSLASKIDMIVKCSRFEVYRVEDALRGNTLYITVQTDTNNATKSLTLERP